MPGIGYDGTPGTEKSAADIAAAVGQAIGRAWGGGEKCNLIHVHNPLLAKNAKFTEIVRQLQKLGFTLLLQVHDFAEDGRPAAYYRDCDYPADCHYCVINRRDYRLLTDAGLDTEGLHLLPNSVSPVDPVPSQKGRGDFVLFPVRAIRRKNIGEALLLSLFLPTAVKLYITLPPNSPPDFPSYHHWQRIVAQYKLPVAFEMGLKQDFRSLLRDTRHVVSTSISEGFGFAFLEPWVAGKHMEGRSLPDICSDFTEAGVDLDHLYPQLRVPVDWIGRKALIDRFQTCYDRNCRLFGVTAQMPSASAFSEPLQAAATIDFGMLDEPLQTRIIEMVATGADKREELGALNPSLGRLGSSPASVPKIERNRRRILEAFGPRPYRDRLQAIYQKVSSRSVRHRIDKLQLLRSFMNYNYYSLLKWNTYSETS